MLQPGEKTQRVVPVLVTWVVLLAVFGVYEWFFVRSQREFLEKEAFRTLAAVAKGLSTRVDKVQRSSASFLRLRENQSFSDLSKEKQDGWLNSYLDSYLDLKDKKIQEKAVKAAKDCAPSDKQAVPLPSILSPDGLTLSIYCSASGKTDQHNPGRNSPSEDTGPKASTISSEKPKTGQTNRKEILSYDITPNASNFSGLDEQDDLFDDVLVADLTGRVLFQKSQTGPRIANLRSLIGGDVQKSEATQKPEQNNSSSDGHSSSPGGAVLQKLAQASAVTDITVADVNYKLFSQPVHLPVSSTSNAEQTTDLLVCAVVNARRFDKESQSVPYSKVIWAAMIGVLLFSLSWPLFKLRYMSVTERFSVKDRWYLMLAIFLTSTSGTLMIINLSYTVGAREADDATLKQLADQIKHHFGTEMMDALAQLQQLRPVADRLARNSGKSGKLVPNYFDGENVQPTCYPYPFFEAAFWTDKAGQQMLRLDVKGASTPAIDVSSFPYFQAVMQAGKLGSQPPPAWEATLPCPVRTPDSPEDLEKFDDIFNSNRAYIHPVLSPNTDEFSVVLADMFVVSTSKNPQTFGIEALAIEPISLVKPVLPPGYGFAVIDGDCTVLFHSQSFRNMRENFCQESKDSYELRPVLLSGVDTPMDVSYLGQTERAYVTDVTSTHFAAGPAFLIVFRQPGVQLTLNLAIILVCSILLGAYLAVLVLIAVVYLVLRHPFGLIYPPEFVWPQQWEALSYLALFAANSVVLLAFWCFYSHLFEAPLLAMSLAVPAVSTLFLVLRLSAGKYMLAPIGGVLVVVGAVLFLGSFVLTPQGMLLWFKPGMPALLAWGLLLLLIGAVAVLLSGWRPRSRKIMRQTVKIRIMRLEKKPTWLGQKRSWLKGACQKHYGVAYTLMCVSMIVAVAVVPCLGFFKCAYDAVMELSLKHDQLVLSESLLVRRDRIRRYYDNIKAPAWMVQARLNRVLDLYRIGYCGMVHLPKGPPPVFTVNWDCPVAQAETGAKAEKKPPGNWANAFNERSDHLNDLIEKRIATATLNFPSNRLGSEMSKLGLASTNAEPAWEHSWEEPQPWQFRLTWNDKSRMPNLQIVSEYRQWPGLHWWAYLGLGLLWAILAAWVMRLARQIFFIGVESAPPFEEVDWGSAANIQVNYLLIGHAKSGKSEWLKGILARGNSSGNFSLLDACLELKKMIENPAYKPLEYRGGVLVLDHFDYNMWDGKYNEKRLELLESLVYETANCRLVVASTVDPLYFLTEEAPGVFSPAGGTESRWLLDRWTRALGRFKIGSPKEPMTERFIKKFVDFIDAHPKKSATEEKRTTEFVEWVCTECNCTTMLRKIGIDLFDEFDIREPDSYESLVSTVLDRAGEYYHILWTSLTYAERLVLYQLALDGWTNAKNRDAIQQLERKQLIYKAPMYRIMNDSFLRFIKSPEHATEILEWQKQERASTWHAFRTVLIVVAAGVTVWMVYTQAALSQTVIGVIAGSTALLTAVGGLLGLKPSKAPNGS